MIVVLRYLLILAAYAACGVAFLWLVVKILDEADVRHDQQWTDQDEQALVAWTKGDREP